jgi:ABC-type transporter Mla subunit MlaD
VQIVSESTPATAQIIPFPLRRRPVQGDGHERLERALATLDTAIANQRAAVAAWRCALADLSRVVTGLGDGLQRYRGNLDGLAVRVDALRAQAVQLERTAETARAAAGE